MTSVRELAILQQAQHPNIVSLLKVVTGTRPDRCAGCGAPCMDLSCENTLIDCLSGSTRPELWEHDTHLALIYSSTPYPTGLCSCNSVTRPPTELSLWPKP